MKAAIDLSKVNGAYDLIRRYMHIARDYKIVDELIAIADQMYAELDKQTDEEQKEHFEQKAGVK